MNLKQRENMIRNIGRLTTRLHEINAYLEAHPTDEQVREKQHRLRCAIARRQQHDRDILRKRARGWQAKWLADKVVIATIKRTRGLNGAPNWSSLWDVQRELAPVPAKVVLAKLRSMDRRRLFVNSCTCGCRGDFELLPELLSL